MKGINLTDPEFASRLDYFLNEVKENENQKLDKETRTLAILSVLVATQSIDLYKVKLDEVLHAGYSPVVVKEMVYQAVDYLGLGKVYPFILATNEVMKENGITLPLESQQTTTIENRLEKGIAAQVEIFGSHMQEAWKNGDINYWLASNCFGDYYTRTGLDLRQRELITFCFLMAQGGCEPQLVAHASGNINMGNDAVFLKKVVAQCLPYIGYPRSLNAINCVEQADTK